MHIANHAGSISEHHRCNEAFGSCQVSLVTGGITNALLKLQPTADSNLAPVLLRIFGDKTDLVIDREKEARVVEQLHSNGFGAQVNKQDKLYICY